MRQWGKEGCAKDRERGSGRGRDRLGGGSDYDGGRAVWVIFVGCVSASVTMQDYQVLSQRRLIASSHRDNAVLCWCLYVQAGIEMIVLPVLWLQ